MISRVHKNRNPEDGSVAKEVIDLFEAVRTTERAGNTDENKMINMLTAPDKVKKEDIDTKDKDGKTLLILASDRGYRLFVNELLEKGADVNAADKDGNTPLLVASGRGYKSIVEMLLINGADINAADADGKTPLILALYPNSTYVTKLHIETAELLIEKGANVNAADNYGFTPLMSVVQNYSIKPEGKKKLIESLMDYGADINAVNSDGNTPLIFAIYRRNQEIIAFLLDNGADALDEENTKKQPLTIAKQIFDRTQKSETESETELEKKSRKEAGEILEIIEKAVEKQEKEKYIPRNKQIASEVLKEGKTKEGKSLVPSEFDSRDLSDDVASYLSLKKVPGGKKKKTKKSKKSRKSKKRCNKKTRKH